MSTSVSPNEKSSGIATTFLDGNSSDSSNNIEPTGTRHTIGAFVPATTTSTQRNLSSRQAHLLAMGSCIGTAFFVSIGGALSYGGSVATFLAFCMWTSIVYTTGLALSEMTVYLPIDSSWIVYTTRWVDESVGVGNAWQFIISEATLVAYEITAFGLILEYWIPEWIEAHKWVFITVVLIIYICVQISGVNIYGEVEFWLSIGKVILSLMMVCYTFIVMVGGNPHHDHFGFRYFAEKGNTFRDYQGNGKFRSYMEGFVWSNIYASFTIAGPDYVSLTAGEIRSPVRKNLADLFQTVIYRLIFFFVIGSLCVGIICPADSPDLFNVGSSAVRSPYVISMNLLDIKGLPDFFNAILLTCIFSSGNGFFFCATRSLYGLAHEGKAPRFFKLCLKNGAPIGAIAFTSAVACLAYLSLGSGSQKVMTWITNISTCSLTLYMFLINVAYLRFRQGLDAQGIDYESLPLTHKYTRYLVWWPLTMNFAMMWVEGYYVFEPGAWDIATFIFNYFMLFLTLFVAICWYILKRPKFLSAAELDLVTGLEEVEEYEANFVEPEKDFKDKLLSIIF